MPCLMPLIAIYVHDKWDTLGIGYAGNPNNNNGWIEADVPLLGELGAEVDEPMVDTMIDEVAEPIAEGED
ncbi:hypothetical protein Tco_1407465 [Tanacetum coccineum]